MHYDRMKTPKHRKTLKAFRDHYGLSQQYVADEIGVNDTTIYRLETGISQPRPLTAKAITRFMDEYETKAGKLAS